MEFKGKSASIQENQRDFVTLQQRNAVFSKFGRKADCEFLVGTKPKQKMLKAHRVILALASPVFKAMFFGGMAERRNPVLVPDIEPSTFLNVLRYIYGIKISKHYITISSIDEACNVYYTATKYILPRLKTKCVGYIDSRLRRHNPSIIKYICPLYEFASFYEEERIMNLCLGIMRNNTRKIINDSSFDEAQLSTVVKIFSLEEIDCTELDMFKALERYAKAQEERMKSSIDLNANSGPSEDKSDATEFSTSKDIVPVTMESSAGNSPESTPELLEHGSGPTVSESKEKPTIRAALQKIRFLTFTAQEFTEGPAKSSLLTESEASAILMNITSDKCNVPIPQGFSTLREHRTDSLAFWFRDLIDSINLDFSNVFF